MYLFIYFIKKRIQNMLGRPQLGGQVNVLCRSFLTGQLKPLWWLCPLLFALTMIRMATAVEIEFKNCNSKDCLNLMACNWFCKFCNADIYIAISIWKYCILLLQRANGRSSKVSLVYLFHTSKYTLQRESEASVAGMSHWFHKELCGCRFLHTQFDQSAVWRLKSVD